MLAEWRATVPSPGTCAAAPRSSIGCLRRPTDGGTDVFVHISAVERAGMRDLNEGQKISYDVVADKRTGKSSADNLKPA